MKPVKRTLKELLSLRDNIGQILEHEDWLHPNFVEGLKKTLDVTEYHIKHYEQYQKEDCGL